LSDTLHDLLFAKLKLVNATTPIQDISDRKRKRAVGAAAVDPVCATALQPTVPTYFESNKLPEIQYAFGEPYTKVTEKGVGDFFSNAYPALCPIQTCSLLKGGCVEVYTDPSLLMEARAPFDIYALGATSYSKPVCIECYNGKQWAYNSFTATYAGKPDCSADLVLADHGLTSTIAYDSTNTDGSYNLAIPSNGNSDYITNTNSKCPVTTCYLKANDCVSVLDAGTASFLAVSTDAPFYIFAVNNVAAGWTT
jgi:hypothetical protein